MNRIDDTKYSTDNIYHICRGPQLDDVTVCRSYADYLSYFEALRKAGKGTRYLYTQMFSTGRRNIYHFYLREVDEHEKTIVS